MKRRYKLNILMGKPSDELLEFVLAFELDGKFAVQSIHFARVAHIESDLVRTFTDAAKLFMEVEPLERCAWAPTLKEALADHDRDFDDMMSITQ